MCIARVHILASVDIDQFIGHSLCLRHVVMPGPFYSVHVLFLKEPFGTLRRLLGATPRCYEVISEVFTECEKKPKTLIGRVVTTIMMSSDDQNTQ